MRKLKTYAPTLNFQGRTIREWCERATSCCAEPLTCGNGFEFPETLMMTLSGFSPPDVCNYSVEDTDPANYLGAVSGYITDANAWNNGSYQLKRVPYEWVGYPAGSPIAAYILTDTQFPFVSGTLESEVGDGATPGAIKASSASGDYVGVFPLINTTTGLYGNTTDGNGCNGPNAGVGNGFDGLLPSKIAVAPATCNYAPDCAYDAIYVCGPQIAGDTSLNYEFLSDNRGIYVIPNLISFNETAIAAWMAHPAADTDLPGPADSFRDCNGVLTRSKASVQVKAYKQCIVSIGCDGIPSFLFTTYIATTFNSELAFCDHNAAADFPQRRKIVGNVQVVSYANPVLDPSGDVTATGFGATYEASTTGAFTAGRIDLVGA